MRSDFAIVLAAAFSLAISGNLAAQQAPPQLSPAAQQQLNRDKLEIDKRIRELDSVIRAAEQFSASVQIVPNPDLVAAKAMHTVAIQIAHQEREMQRQMGAMQANAALITNPAVKSKFQALQATSANGVRLVQLTQELLRTVQQAIAAANATN